LPVDHEILLDLARKSADTIAHAAAPVTAFLVGYAPGSRGVDAFDSLASTAGVASTLSTATIDAARKGNARESPLDGCCLSSLLLYYCGVERRRRESVKPARRLAKEVNHREVCPS
jgi:hypothetical protein